MIRLALVTLTAIAGHALAQPDVQPESTAITIYSTAAPGAIPAWAYRPVPQSAMQWQNMQYYGQVPGSFGYGVVRHERNVGLNEGRTEIKFTGVAALLDPTTVSFTSLTDPAGTRVIEQSYQFDLVGREKLLEKYIDKLISFDLNTGGGQMVTITGTLLNAAGGMLIVRDGNGQLHSTGSAINVRFPTLPEGLITRPTLIWDIQAAQGGDHRTRVSYQAEGMTWWADYNLTFTEGEDANSGLLDVGAWVSILNRSGATYEDAKLKLVAGDVHRAPQPGMAMPAMTRGARFAEEAALGFEQKSFFEYHLYTLGRATTIPDNSTKQIELFDTARGVPAEKVLVYYGLAQQYRGFFPSPVEDRNYGIESNRKVDVYLQFRNDEDSGLGIPLPSGRIRVSKLDPADGALEFIGEDVIDHTPRDENVLIKLGEAFDVVGERTQTDFRIHNLEQWMEESVKVVLRNHKDEPVKVIIKENMFRWVNWEITKTSHEWEKQDARTIHVPVSIPAHGEIEFTYTVRYTW